MQDITLKNLNENRNNILKKICFITSSRAEYGLLSGLMKTFYDSPEFEFQLIATGMHLSKEFGFTYKDIEDDGFDIDIKVDMKHVSDSPIDITRSIGHGHIGFAEAFERLGPDMIVVLGDRYDIFPGVIAAMIARIPIIHIHGGESTEGVIDEAIRHSITKMAHLHFTATEEYSNRVVQLGEQPSSVYNVGSLGIDNIHKLKLLSKSELEKKIGFKFGKKNLLITFHPSILESNSTDYQFKQLIRALSKLKETNLIFTKSNADQGGRAINHLIDEYVKDHPSNSISFVSMGQLNYLSTMKIVDGVVGNSSSGIIETPSFSIGTVNIGERQSGRVKSKSVIDCNANETDIYEAIQKLYSRKFQMICKKSSNLYGKPGASDRIFRIIKNYDFNEILKKKFYNIKCNF